MITKRSRRGAPPPLPPATPPRRFYRHVRARDDVVLQIAESALEVVRAVERRVDALAAGPRHAPGYRMANKSQARPAPRARHKTKTKNTAAEEGRKETRRCPR